MRLLLRVAVALLLLGYLGCSKSKKSPEAQTFDPKETNSQMLEFYTSQSPWTDPGDYQKMFDDIPKDINSVVESVQGSLIHGGLAWLYKLTPSKEQANGFSIRKTEELLWRIKLLDDAGLGVHRPKEKRLIVNCRQFAVLTCSILRHKDIPARVRAGYALYTWGRGKYENHWICEYWNRDKQRWIQVDAQIDARQKKLMKIDFNTLDIPKGKFVTAGEGWQRYRHGEVEVENFGLGGKDGWNGIGWSMVMPNVTCDIMALNKTELLPWDVNKYWSKSRTDMTEKDIALIDKAADLLVRVDTQWGSLRKFYESHLSIFLASENFQNGK